MKKVTVLLLALVLCYAASAQKITFRLNAAANYGFIPNHAEALLLDMSLPPGTPFNTIPSYQPATFHTRFTEKPGAKLGGSIGVHINPKFSLETGLQVNLVRFQKTDELTFPDAGTGAGTSDPVLRRWRDPSKDESGDGLARDNDGNLLYDANGNPIRMRFNDGTNTPFPGRSYNDEIEPDPKAGNTAIVYIDIPINLRYNLHKLVDLKVGFTTSQLVYAERYLPTVSYSSDYSLKPPPNFRGTDPYDPTWQPAEAQPSYTKYKSGKSFNKTLFSFTTGITLNATRHIGLDLDYARYLTPIYTSQAEKHPHRYNLFSTGMSYAF